MSFSKLEHKTQWIPVKQLSVVWAQSQREFDQKHAQAIAADFDPDMFGVLSVTMPDGDGMYHIIDGQHRKDAVQHLYGEDEMVPCNVFNVSDPARAAKMFDRINKARKAPGPIDTFKVRVTAGEETEVAVNKIVRAAGYKISKSHGTGTISAVSALVAIYRSFGGEVLRVTLATIKATWGTDDENAVVAPILRGYGSLLAEHKHHIDLKRLIDRTMNRMAPGRLVGEARSVKESMRISVADSIKHVLLHNYNHGLRKGQLEPKPRHQPSTNQTAKNNDRTPASIHAQPADRT